MENTRSSVSTREAGIWASLLTTLAIYATFVTATATGWVKGGGQIGLLIGLVVVQTIALIIFHIVLAILRGDEAADERDRLISLRAYRAAYIVLMGCVASVTLMYVAWAGVASVPDAAAAGLRGPSVTLVGHAMLLSFVAAEFTQGATQIILYRRGV